MARTRIKFCGITRIDDLQEAVALGVDAVGIVFCPSSPRAVNVQQACALIDRCTPFVTCVGLFMNQDAGTINQIMQEVSIDMLQFHGEESADFCASFGLPYLKSVAMGSETLSVSELDYPTASALLLDSNELGQAGGSGKQFDWKKIPSIEQPVILAGGLEANNVTAAIKQVRPFAVDVSSGIEKAKGIKDIKKMKEFVNSVRVADEC
ncbi:MAG: phosphoribosylanthranilate isomerase [Phycisphaeraceae bacterium]|nr:phosphoribosylanthranilate isomerase [Phycisphaeraceae bacterium]